ncbi:MAG: hypothetical protein H7335_13250 [Massilia sp.]|nr:hypothetical protein [Massilia sp.]
MTSTKPGQRKLQILQALADMLAQPKSEKITTAALARQLRMNQFYDKVELACKQSLRLAATQGHGREADVGARASLLVSYVVGRWHRFAKSGFKHNPAEGSALRITLLLAARESA